MTSGEDADVAGARRHAKRVSGPVVRESLEVVLLVEEVMCAKCNDLWLHVETGPKGDRTFGIAGVECPSCGPTLWIVGDRA